MAEALALNGQPDGALELIHSHANSEDARPCINAVTYTTDLKASPIPSVHTVAFNTMSDACAKCNAMHRASSLVVEMRQSAVELVVITYSTLVQGYCCEGHADTVLYGWRMR